LKVDPLELAEWIKRLNRLSKSELKVGTRGRKEEHRR
jgi:hypothetical protein